MSKNKLGYDTWESIPALKATAQELGNHFFEAGSMKFFGSRLESGIIAGQWFITSEQEPTPPHSEVHHYRKFTVRRAVRVNLDRLTIETVGLFQEHDNLEQARAAVREARDLAEAEDVPPPVSERLEYLRGEIVAERISQGEILELQSLAEHIESGDVLLLEWAGVPEHPEPPAL